MKLLLSPLAAAALWAAVPSSSTDATELADIGQLASSSRGAAVYERCAGCHSLDRNRVGPAHRGVFGREAGTIPGFRYSKALMESTVVWDETSLDLWLADPGAFIPGSRMGYRLRDAKDRADVIAFLREAGRTKTD